MSLHTVLYVLGPPGVGKTTLVRNLLGLDRPPTPADYEFRSLLPKPKWTLVKGICAAGHYTGQPFDGGDTVPYTGARECLDYWIRALFPLYPLTILDGDRFSTKPSLEYIQEHDRVLVSPRIRIAGIHLVASPETLATRRSERGSNQNAVWMKGRETKARNFAERIGALDMNAALPIDTLATMVRSNFHEHFT